MRLIIIYFVKNDRYHYRNENSLLYYGVAVVDFYALNGNYKTPWDPSYNPIPKGSGVHPNAEGMAFMAEYMWTQTESYLTGD